MQGDEADALHPAERPNPVGSAEGGAAQLFQPRQQRALFRLIIVEFWPFAAVRGFPIVDIRGRPVPDAEYFAKDVGD